MARADVEAGLDRHAGAIPGSLLGDKSSREDGCPRMALTAVVLALAGATALLAPCLHAAGLGTVVAVGAAWLAAVFAVVLVIVSVSVLAAPALPGRRGTASGARLAGPTAAAQRACPSCGPPTGILSASGRCWLSGRATPHREAAAPLR